MKVTMYFQGMLGVSKVEATTCAVEVKPYAQYTRSVHVEFVPRGKRKARSFVQSYKPSLLVLEGWNHPDPDSMFLPAEDHGDVMVAHGRYSACDPRWQGDFDTKIAAYLERSSAKVVHDFRGHDPSSWT